MIVRQKIHSYGFRVWPPDKTGSVSLKKDSPCSVSFLCPSYEANMHTHSAALLFDLHKFWNLSLPELLEKSSGTEQGLGAFPHPKPCWFYLALSISSTTVFVTRWPQNKFRNPALLTPLLLNSIGSTERELFRKDKWQKNLQLFRRGKKSYQRMNK